jgi:hypothetical protein
MDLLEVDEISVFGFDDVDEELLNLVLYGPLSGVSKFTSEPSQVARARMCGARFVHRGLRGEC